MEKSKEKKEKTPAPAIDSFPTDETPTPTKILRMADMDLFQDLKENPFDVHFRKATEAVKAGQDSLSASLSATEIPTESEESLNTPQIYCSLPSTVTPVSRPVILRSHDYNKVSSNIPIASVQPVKPFKPIAPNPSSLAFSPNSDNALLLLKFPGGETVKLSNLPFVKCDSSKQQAGAGTVNTETKLKLKKTLNIPSSIVTSLPSTASLPTSAPVPVSSSMDRTSLLAGAGPEDKDDLKERNRMSAQRSRQKKRQQLEHIQKEKAELELENSLLRAEVLKLRKILNDHLECSVTVKAGQVGSGVSKQNIETQTSGPQQQNLNRDINYPHQPVFNSSPPQTYPEDLRVDTKLKEESSSGPSPAGDTGEGKNSKIKQTLALHCAKVGHKRKLKQTNKQRLKDKLQIIKQKMVEDEDVWSKIQSTNKK